MKLTSKTALALGPILSLATHCMAQEAQAASRSTYEKPFIPGAKAPFIGIFTHAETSATLEGKIESARQALEENPYLSGMTIKIQWSQLHPEKDVWEWDKLEKLISTIAAFNKLAAMGIMSGSAPRWIFDEGAVAAASGRGDSSSALPWDPVYMKWFSADLRAIAQRYANDPRIMMIQVQGHNYRGEEMHAPAKESLAEYGWSREVVLNNWHYWIDLYNGLFPQKRLSLVVSQMYPGESDLPEEVASYFVEKCQGRAVLQTDQLNGREDALQQSSAICQKFSDRAPHCHEMVGSFKEQPERQGTPEMTVYNFVKLGNPLYLQIWRRDADDPQYAKALLDAWNTYEKMPPAELKARLQAEGKFIETSNWQRPGASQANSEEAQRGEGGSRRRGGQRENSS